MLTKLLKGSTFLIATAVVATTAATGASAGDVYGAQPVTVKGYSGDKTNSVSYSGQVARYVLHDSLKKLAGKGDGGGNAEEIEVQMLSYFQGSDNDLPIIAPAGKDGFPFKQSTVNEISKGKNLEGKFYNGAMPAWPGDMTGREAIVHMIKHAAKSDGGYDAENGYDWAQLISKFTLGGVSYNQAVDNYLDEKMQPDNKPNGKPYKEGAPYTGKEHSWDEAFGYFGAAAHSGTLSPDQNYAVAKMKDLASADANGDGVVDLKSEYVFGNAYYAAGADRSGVTNYMDTIMSAFIDGRNLIASANGENLTPDQLAKLQQYAKTINDAWETVLAEAVFKYAGSVYKDITKMKEAKTDEEKAKAYRAYVKHWGELKGFAMALQTGKNNLGETAVQLNRLIGYGPVTADNSYVTGIDADGNFVRDRKRTWSDYQLHMLKVQKMLINDLGVKARGNDATSDLASLADKLDADSNAETD
ncbi:MAG: DUF4856 domain-containing protein [Pseudomonadota bacterium]